MEKKEKNTSFWIYSRRDIGGRLGPCPDPVSDSRPDGQLLAEAPVIPALRVPAREPARRPGEPAATDSHPRRSVPAAARIPRDTDAAGGPASTGQHAGHHPRAHVGHQWVKNRSPPLEIPLSLSLSLYALSSPEMNEREK